MISYRKENKKSSVGLLEGMWDQYKNLQDEIYDLRDKAAYISVQQELGFRKLNLKTILTYYSLQFRIQDLQPIAKVYYKNAKYVENEYYKTNPNLRRYR